MRRVIGSEIVAGLLCLAAVQCGHAAITGVQRLAVGHTLNFPAFATHAPGDLNRLFVTELGGNIKVVDLNNLNAAPAQFLNISDTDPAGEGGLLGLAFHPNYFAPPGTTGRGKFYVYVTVDNGGINIGGAISPFSSHIREYTVVGDPATSNVADPASKREILQFVQPQSNHNAGWIGFNPEFTAGQPQYLYISSGDGGGGNDDGAGHTADIGNAQDLSSNLLGKMLRIDVNGDDFTGGSDPQDIRNYAIPPTNPFVSGPGDPTNAKDDEIYAYGLRNPFRNSFDRLTGDLWIGDVGQGQREEIDFLLGSSNGGENYGWRLREGNVQTPGVGGPPPADYVAPIYDYARGTDPLLGETVIGGYRYRGQDPDLRGRYFFGDASDDNVWQMIPPDPVAPNTAVTNIDSSLNNLAGIDRVVSFGEDARGNLYIVDMASGPNNAPNANSGEVYRILTSGDFDRNGVVDDADIDLLAWAAQNDPTNPFYDLNGVGGVTFAPSESGFVSDSDVLIRKILLTNYGDLDLNGQVDLGDANVLAFNFNDPGSFGWADGNVDGLSGVTLGDANILAFFFEFPPPGTAANAAIPEPSGCLLVFCAILAIQFARILDVRRPSLLKSNRAF